MAIKLNTILNHRSKSMFAERAWGLRESRLRVLALDVGGDESRFTESLGAAVESRRVKRNDFTDLAALIAALIPSYAGIRKRRKSRRPDKLDQWPAFYTALTAAAGGADVESAVTAAVCKIGKLTAAEQRDGAAIQSAYDKEEAILAAQAAAALAEEEAAAAAADALNAEESAACGICIMHAAAGGDPCGFHGAAADGGGK